MAPPLSAVILAGGEGRRLLDVTGGVPKQFWSPDGRPSLLERTLVRIAPVAPADRSVVVTGPGQNMFAAVGRGVWGGRVVAQPADRGTAFAVVFGLIGLPCATGDDLILVTPSDHGVADPDRFRRCVLQAAAAIVRGVTGIVVFGATPHEPTPDYGWLTLGAPCARNPEVREVTAFVEKPAVEEARSLFASGAVWNTLVLVARVRALLGLYEAHLPHVAEAYERLLGARADACADVLRQAYLRHAPADFSRDVLTHARGLVALTLPASVGWTDLGTPERLGAWYLDRQSRERRRRTGSLG